MPPTASCKLLLPDNGRVHLKSNHVGVRSRGREQLRVRATLYDSTILEHQNKIGFNDGAQSMSDHKGSPSLHQQL